jgi:hypothetical protein
MHSDGKPQPVEPRPRSRWRTTGDVNVDLAAVAGSRAVILIEGVSDQVALETLAGRRGRPLGPRGVVVVPMGGAAKTGRFVDLLGPRGLNARLAGLCDRAEAGYVRRALARAGYGAAPPPAAMEALGFYVCTADLEDELIRTLGPGPAEQIIAAHGEIRSFRLFQQQPAQHARTPQAQLHRFLSTRSGRKSHYAQLLVNALDPTRIPRPLDRVLTHL